MNAGPMKEKALEAQRLGSEFAEARGRYAGPFPSLACDPTLQFDGEGEEEGCRTVEWNTT